MSDYQGFLVKLCDKSVAGRIQWRLTAESDVFAASIENEFTVKVSKTTKNEFIFEMYDNRDHQLVSLTAEKAHAWEQGYEEPVETFECLRKLHGAARRVALDVDNQLLRAASLLDRA